MIKSGKITRFVFNNTTAILFVLLFVIFGIMAPRFFTLKNFENIMSSASYIGILSVGMTFVLLTGGIDLSVGSTMYLSAVICGLIINDFGLPIPFGIIGCLGIGFLVGWVNSLIITRLRIVPFLSTLITMTIVSGLGLVVTKSKAVDFPDSITLMSSVKVLGFIPLQTFIFLMVVLVASVYLRMTKQGRQLYAVGYDEETATKAGIKTRPMIASTYIISGVLAALGGFVSITQLGRVSANFGSGEEFDAIAAAVLGGASLFGGIGTVFPGTILGAVMIQMIQAGLIFIDVDLYIQPIVMASIIFLAVFLDSIRNIQLKIMRRRHIMKI